MYIYIYTYIYGNVLDGFGAEHAAAAPQRVSANLTTYGHTCATDAGQATFCTVAALLQRGCAFEALSY